MSLGLRTKLSVMMFLQYFVWGIWMPVLAQQLGENGVKMPVHLTGWIFAVGGYGSILGPFVIGQLADRYFSSEKVMAFCHLLGGLLLILAGYLTTFWPIFMVLFVYSTLYMPTMGLSNSITFRSIGEGNQDAFPGIRMWGTIGWIAAGLSYAAYYLEKAGQIGALKPMFDLVGKPSSSAIASGSPASCRYSTGSVLLRPAAHAADAGRADTTRSRRRSRPSWRASRC